MADEMIKLGWEEWLALPDLDLPAIKAKIDTGARTSALSATDIEAFGPASARKIRFTVHPDPGNYDLAVPCKAAIKDQRSVTSSNGETELRYVIETTLRVGGESWPIEVTLTDRAGMAYHMLLGRMALVDRCVVVPGAQHEQPILGYDLYRQNPATAPQNRSLRVALLSSKPASKAAKALTAEAQARGHMFEVLDPAGLTVFTSATAPAVLQGDTPLPRFDAVLARMQATRRNLAVLRQFEALGSYTPNSAEGMAAAADPVRTQQVLARHHIAIEDMTDAKPQDAQTATVIGKRVRSAGAKLSKQHRATVLRAARAFKLGCATVHLRMAGDRLTVLGLSARPDIPGTAKKRKPITALLFDLIEKRARPRPKTGLKGKAKKQGGS